MSKIILIVDDEVDLASTCARILERLGFSCLTAYDRPEALSLFDSERPTLVLSDIHLPTGNGFEIARYVRMKSPNVPIILMTAYHSGNAREQAIRSGAAHYLRKPFSNSELISAVNSLVAP